MGRHFDRDLTHATGDPVAWGVDAASKVSLGTMRSLGATFVCCYLAPTGQAWKTRTPDDIHDYLANGYAVVFNYESGGTPGDGWSTGVAAAGRSVAQLVEYHNHCAACAAKIGLTAPVIFTFADMESPNLDTLSAALQGAASVIGLARVGGYGGYATVKWLFDRGLVTYGWQTYGWSHGLRDPRAQLYQRLNTATIDYDVAYARDFGQVPRPGGPATSKVEPVIQNFPVVGAGDLELNVPLRGMSSLYGGAWVSARSSAPGARVDVWWGLSGQGGRGERHWLDMAANARYVTENGLDGGDVDQATVQYNFGPGVPGVITLECAPK